MSMPNLAELLEPANYNFKLYQTNKLKKVLWSHTVPKGITSNRRTGQMGNSRAAKEKASKCASSAIYTYTEWGREEGGGEGGLG